MNKDCLLLVFIKNPVLGKVKTRLAHTIGEEKALLIYEKLLAYTRSTVQGLPAAKWVCYSDFIPAADAWIEAGFRPIKQQGQDLGERMLRAFSQGFTEGYQRMVIVGSDCAEITTHLISTAFQLLDTSPVVIGPAADGGYYLLGMNQLIAAVFRQKPWSTALVLPETVKELNQLAISFHLLPVLNDVDEAADLDRLPEDFLS